MALTKIHLNLLDISGPSWKDITPETIDKLHEALRSLPVQGTAPDRYTIPGVTRVDDAIGGFFVTEYDHEAIEYDEQKRETRTVRNEWEKTAFVMLPRIGKILVQSRQYPKGLTADHVDGLFKPTFRAVIRSADLGDALIVELLEAENEDAKFLEIFEEPDNRIVKMSVSDLQPTNSLEGLTYYNPQRERNEIIAQSHIHDFGIMGNITVDTGGKRTNLRDAHMMKSAVRAGHNQEIRYVNQNGRRRKLEREIKVNYELMIDLDVEIMRDEDVRRLSLLVLEEYGLAEVPEIPPGPYQRSIFDAEYTDHDSGSVD